MDIAVLQIAELRDGEAATVLAALELRKVCRMIEEVLIGRVEMHQRLLKRLAVDFLKPVVALGTLEHDKILRLLGIAVALSRLFILPLSS